MDFPLSATLGEVLKLFVGLSDEEASRGCYYNLAFNPNFYKIEQIRKVDNYSGDKAPFNGHIRVFLDLNAPVCFDDIEDYNVKVYISKGENDIAPMVYILPESYKEVYGELRSFILVGLGIESGHSKIVNNLITYNEIIELNSKKDKDKDKGSQVNYTLAYIEPFNERDIIPMIESCEIQQEKNVLQNINKFLVKPDSDELAGLFDFTSVPIDYTFNPDKSEFPDVSSYKDFEREMKKIIDGVGIDPDICRDLMIAFNIEKYLELNGKKTILGNLRNFLHYREVNMGSIVYGPPGTGKTYSISEIFMPIFKYLFGYEVYEVPASKLEAKSQYYGARQRAVDAVFVPALKKIQKSQKPCFIFVDEGDKIVQKDTGRRDDNEGIAAMKNYLNPSRYAGVIVCVCTNLTTQGAFDDGIAERRIEMLEYNYPGIDIAKTVWKKDIKELIFHNESPHFFILKNDKKTRLKISEVYTNLAKLVAKNVGLDVINSFCKRYRSKTRTIPTDPINFKSFKVEFYKFALKRINQREEVRIAKANSRYGGTSLVDKNAIERIRQDAKEQRERLGLALRNESIDKKDGSIREIRVSLSKNDTSNIYYVSYVKVRDIYLSLIKEYYEGKNVAVDYMSLKKLFQNVKILKEYFSFGLNLVDEEILNENKFQEYFQAVVNSIYEFSSICLAKSGDDEILMEVPELIGKDSEILTSQVEDYFYISVAKFFQFYLPSKVFKLEEFVEEKIQVPKGESKTLSKEEIDGFQKTLRGIETNLNAQYNSLGNLYSKKNVVSRDKLPNLNQILDFKKTLFEFQAFLHYSPEVKEIFDSDDEFNWYDSIIIFLIDSLDSFVENPQSLPSDFNSRVNELLKRLNISILMLNKK